MVWGLARPSCSRSALARAEGQVPLPCAPQHRAEILGSPPMCTIIRGGGTGSPLLCTTTQGGGTGSPPLSSSAQAEGTNSPPLCTAALGGGTGSPPLRTTALGGGTRSPPLCTSAGGGGTGSRRRCATLGNVVGLDRLDDTLCLRGVFTKGDLNQQILDVQSDVDVSHLGHGIPSVCALVGDGKAMLSATYHKGKCWVGCSCINCLERASCAPPRYRWGSFLRAIGPCNRVGNVGHGPCRNADAIVKQINETIKGFIETGASDFVWASREAGKALVLELHEILDEVKNVPHAQRLAPRPTKAGKFDITGAKRFLRTVHCMHGLWPSCGTT